MSDKVILSRAHRDALYRELLGGLGDELDDLRRFGKSKDPETLEGLGRIGRRVADALRLIQDGGLGWGFPAGKDPLELKLPREELRRIMEALRGDCATLEESERAEREEEQRHWRQTRESREACNAVLDQLGER